MEHPIDKRKRIPYRRTLLLLLILIIAIKVISLNNDWVETFYSTGFYVNIGKVYRFLFGWLPISIGDILYAGAFIYLVWLFVKLIKRVKARKLTRFAFFTGLKKIAIVIGLIYIVFNINWGLNYNRRGLKHQLNISTSQHTKEDLVAVSDLLLHKVNETRKAVNDDLPSDAQIFTLAKQAYANASKQYPFLRYQNESIKRSLYGKAGNYFGFSGYYNPFTGESQLNLTLPRFLIPLVTCHEIAHQVGYASESEANFVGYLTAVHSSHPFFHYSGYLDLFTYTNREVARRDSLRAKENYARLDTLVKRDLTELKEFYKKYKNPIEPIIWTFYDTYLKANQQDKGVESYNQVVGLLIAYYRKNGKI